MKVLDPVARHAHWALRVVLASVFLYHGLTKFPTLGGTAEMMGLLVFVLLLVALAEFGGGILILLGGVLYDWMTRLGALLIIPVMIGAIFMVHWPQWAFTPSETHPMSGMEFQVTLLLISVYFVLKGNKANVGRISPESA